MRPDLSVILLTTLIGAGQGLYLAMFSAELYGALGVLPVQSHGFHGTAALLALVLTGAGLAASFFHLGRPERGWRAIAQWRTSWLSREVIVLPAFMAVVFLHALAHWIAFTPRLAGLPGGGALDATLALGMVGAALALALYVCTGMIYASLPFLREWHSPLTVLNIALLGLASGFTLAAAYAAGAGSELAAFFTGWALVLTLLGLAARSAALVRNARLRPKSTLQTAIGVKHPRIVQTAQGFMGGSFNTREFFHGRSPRTVQQIKWIFLALGFVLPILLTAAVLAGAAPVLLAPAFATQMLGLMAERWYFFAEARHPQNIYYQAIT